MQSSVIIMLSWYKPWPIYSKQVQALDNVNTKEHESRPATFPLFPSQILMLQKILALIFPRMDEAFPVLKKYRFCFRIAGYFEYKFAKTCDFEKDISDSKIACLRLLSNW